MEEKSRADFGNHESLFRPLRRKLAIRDIEQLLLLVVKRFDVRFILSPSSSLL